MLPDSRETGVENQTEQASGAEAGREQRVGDSLLRRCVDHLSAGGAKLIYGFASFAGYLFWRGPYMSAEPDNLSSPWDQIPYLSESTA